MKHIEHGVIQLRFVPMEIVLGYSLFIDYLLEENKKQHKHGLLLSVNRAFKRRNRKKRSHLKKKSAISSRQ